MILETLPEVMSLSPHERSQLFEELWEEWLPCDDRDNHAAIVELLDTRAAHFRKAPESASTWDELKQKIEGIRQCRP